MKPTNAKAHALLHQGVLALAGIEENGIRIDTDYLTAEDENVASRIDELGEQLKSDDVYRQWTKKYGIKTNLGSRSQLVDIIFNVLGYEATMFTETKKPSGDEEHLELIDEPFLQLYIEREKLRKLKNTYIKNVLLETVDGYLHPFFDVHLVKSFRSSSSRPNFQNIPVRDKKLGKIIRRAFIPRPGRLLVEIDYGQIEVRVAACYHQDPTMIDYLVKDHDMHFDMAMDYFELEPDQVSKSARDTAKTAVFAAFYGDYYVQIAKKIWHTIAKTKMETKDGTPMKKHLRSQGIKALGACNPKGTPLPGTFEHHVKQIQDHFWGERFPIYDQWRTDWYAAYQKRGWLKLKTGFVIPGLLTRNEAVNVPIQGSAFHCLLWSLARIPKRIRQKKMKTLVVGQIHDSILFDVPRDELDDLLDLAKGVMVDELQKAWDWIIVPLVIDAEASDRSWHDKEKIAC